MATIKPIESRSVDPVDPNCVHSLQYQVQQIQSGQVIVDLCSVVKELVENSLDAGATSIGMSLPRAMSWIDSFLEVRFKNSGLEAIEIQDNGHGIAPEDFESVGTSSCEPELVADVGSSQTPYLETVHLR